MLRHGMGLGQMRHCQQFQLAVKNAKNFITPKINVLNVVPNLSFCGGIAKAQIPIMLVQCQQVLHDALTMRGAERTDGRRPAFCVRHGKLLFKKPRVYPYT